MAESSNEGEVRATALMAMAWPVIASQAGLLLMQFIDIWMVSRLGSTELAAVGGASLAILSLATLGSGFLTAVSSLVGHAFGAGLRKRCVHLAWQGMWSALAIGALFLFLQPTLPYFYHVLGHSAPVQIIEIAYSNVMLWALVPQLLALALSNFFLATRHPRIVLLGVLASVLVNALVSYGLIFGKLGLPNVGFIGAAYGTLIASLVHFLLLLALFACENKAKEYGALRPTFSKSDLSNMWRLGSPAGLQDAIDWGTLGLILVFLVGKFGDSHLAATAILFRIMQLVLLPADGLGTVLTALIANAMGEKNATLARSIAKLGLLIIASYMTFMSVTLYAFRAPIIGFFSSDPSVIAIALQLFVCVSLFQLLDTLNVTFIHALQGVGDCLWPSIVNFALSVIIMLLGGWVVVSVYPQLGSFGIWFLAALLTGAQGFAFWARWSLGPWVNMELDKSTNNDGKILLALSRSDLNAISKLYGMEADLRARMSK